MPETASKWVSSETIGNLAWRAIAAIHVSLIGMEVPAFFNSSRTAAYTPAITRSMSAPSAGRQRGEALIPDAAELHVFGVTCRVVSLEKLIALKRAAGRLKDYEAIAALESLREERIPTDDVRP